MSLRSKVLAPLLLASLLLSHSPATAQQNPAAAPAPAPGNSIGVGDLLVAPTRLIFDGRTRSAELAVVNTGTAPAVYRVSFLHLQMKPDGELVEIESTGALDTGFADTMIRFSPRQVRLEPNVVQTVRLQLRLPAELPDGEYRAHLLFRAIPPPEEAPLEEADENTFRIQLRAVYGVSIPLFVRQGAGSVTGSISGLGLAKRETGPPLATFSIDRKGNRSLYGNLTARLTSGGKEYVVGVMNGVGVYTSIDARSIRMPLQLPKDVPLSGSKLRVTFHDAEKPSGLLLAEASIDLP
ncbi:MAG: fimbria/pilus periplasmic chaperone [Thermoanaerobaculia bacterium]